MSRTAQRLLDGNEMWSNFSPPSTTEFEYEQ